MTVTINKIRQLKSELTEGAGKRVCPNCYFTLSTSKSLSGHYVCPCCEHWIELDAIYATACPSVHIPSVA